MLCYVWPPRGRRRSSGLSDDHDRARNPVRPGRARSRGSWTATKATPNCWAGTESRCREVTRCPAREDQTNREIAGTQEQRPGQSPRWLRRPDGDLDSRSRCSSRCHARRIDLVRATVTLDALSPREELQLLEDLPRGCPWRGRLLGCVSQKRGMHGRSQGHRPGGRDGGHGGPGAR